MENLKIVVAMIVMLIISLLFVRHCTKSDEPVIIHNTTENIVGRVDTFLKVLKVGYPVKGKGKITHDTVYVDSSNGTIKIVNEFTSRLDTIVGKDTLSIVYSYPINVFEFNMKRNDSILYLKSVDTLKITKTAIVTESTPWYEYFIYAVGGFTVGYVLGK